MDVRVYGYTDNIVFIEWKKMEKKMEINKKSYLPEIGFEPMTSGL